MAAPAPRQQLPFAVVMRGFDREQVADRLRRIDAEMRVLAADRDAATANARELAAHLADARDEIDELRSTVDKLSVPPTTVQGMSERLARMLQLASDEASEMRADATAEAAETVSIARQEADERTRESTAQATRIVEEAQKRADGIVADADSYSANTRQHADDIAAKSQADADSAAQLRADRVAAMEAEHETTMDAARAQAAQIDAKAHAQAAELEERTAQTLQRERDNHDAEVARQRADADADAIRIRAIAHEIAAERVARSRDLGSRTANARTEILAELARVQERLAALPQLLATEVDDELTTASDVGDIELLNQALSTAARLDDEA